MAKNEFPKGWNEKRAQRVLDHYESQTEDGAVAEDESQSSLFIAGTACGQGIVPVAIVSLPITA